MGTEKLGAMQRPMAPRENDSVRDGADPPFDINERAELFADRCIHAAMQLPQNGVAWELARQLVRSAGSVGANLEESKGVLTRKDFQYRMSISLREARESLYWLQRVRNPGLLPPGRFADLIQEASEIVSVLTGILKNARARTARCRAFDGADT